MSDRQTIAAKLVAATAAIDAVEKKGRNQQQGYNFVRATDVANEVRKALHEAGIAFTYSVLSERYWDAVTKNGATQYFCSLMVEITFTDSVTGEFITAQSIGWGADTQDKAPYKAMTGALKYALRMNFLIPDESDPEEGDTHETVRPQAPAVHRPPQQNRPPQQHRPAQGDVKKISEAQSKRFFAIAKQGGKSNDDIRRYLMDTCRCERSLDMPSRLYEAACKWAEAPLPVPEPPAELLQPAGGRYFGDGTEITDDDIPF